MKFNFYKSFILTIDGWLWTIEKIKISGKYQTLNYMKFIFYKVFILTIVQKHIKMKRGNWKTLILWVKKIEQFFEIFFKKFSHSPAFFLVETFFLNVAFPGEVLQFRFWNVVKFHRNIFRPIRIQENFFLKIWLVKKKFSGK